jgi:hypothetical protein
LLAASVVCCVFGALALAGPEGFRGVAFGGNLTLAVLLAVLAGQDLMRRGWHAMSVVIGISYVVAPLIGLAAYALASSRTYTSGPMVDWRH